MVAPAWNPGNKEEQEGGLLSADRHVSAIVTLRPEPRVWKRVVAANMSQDAKE